MDRLVLIKIILLLLHNFIPCPKKKFLCRYILNWSCAAKSSAYKSVDIPDANVLSSGNGGLLSPAAASHCVEDALDARSIDKPEIDMALELRGPTRLDPYPSPDDPPDRIDLAAVSSRSSSSASMIALQLSPSTKLLMSGKLKDRVNEPFALLIDPW